MKVSLHSRVYLPICLIVLRCVANAQNCPDCFVQSRVSYYPNSDQNRIDNGAFGFGAFGTIVNGGDVSASSNLYRSGVGCGACYEVRCTNTNYCSDNGVVILSSVNMLLLRWLTADAVANLKSLGVVDVEYQRVACSYPGKT